MSRGEIHDVIKLNTFAVTAIAASLALAACGGTTSPTGTANPTGTSNPTSGGVSGDIFVSGSSTVEPVSLAVSEDFKALNPDFGYTTDVADASRAIRESEAQLCADNGIDYVELLIGVDALTVMTHPDTAIECLNLFDLYALFGPESSDIGTWQDAGAFAAELGSTTAFPADLNLQITAPGEESGTYDAFIELALADLIEEREAEEALRLPGPNYTASPNDNVIVEGVEAGAGSLGFVGYAFYAEAQAAGENVKAIAIDSGDGNCVAPSPEAAADGSYALTRPLFIYPNTTKAAENAALGAWVDFFLSDEGIANVSEVGYVALPESDLEATRQAWDGR
jgi:phosphate transport system substrate-binding protein